MSLLIEAHNLRREYGSGDASTIALHDVSISVREGEFISIMGPSGSGKSTLLHIIGFLDRGTSGSYIFEGLDTAKVSDAERARIRNQKIGFVFQAFHLLQRATTLENVMLPLEYSLIPRREHLKRAQAALEQVGLSHRLTHTPAQLSGGEKQRVAIARALVNNPQVILADEPTGNLDSKSGADVLEIIDTLHEQGHTIIVITHEANTAQFAQRIITMQDGKISSDTVQKNRTHIYKK